MIRWQRIGEGDFVLHRKRAATTEAGSEGLNIRTRASRIAKVAGLRDFTAPSLESVERRRLQLWFLTLALFAAAALALVLLAVRGPIPFPAWATPNLLAGGLLGLVGLFCAYAIEKEFQLRALTRLLVRERMLTAVLTSRMKELSKLLDAGKAMNLVLGLDDVLATILQYAIELCDADSGSVMLVHGEGELRTAGSVGEESGRSCRCRIGEGMAGRVAATRDPLLVNDEEGPNRSRTSCMSIPLVYGSELVGVLTVAASAEWGYTERDLKALGLFGEQAAGAVVNANVYEAQRLLTSQKMYLALHDSLTNLPNRALFLDRVQHALSRRRREGKRSALIYLDLDNFKAVNDRLGHASGDAALLAFGERLRACVRDGDTVARLGGDEFAFLIEDLDSVAAALESAQRIRNALGNDFVIGGERIRLQASIGVAVEEKKGSAADDLLNAADTAMYVSKERGAGDVVLFQPGMGGEIFTRDMEAELADALSLGQLAVHFQPVVSLAAAEIAGVEALLRWRHPARGLLSAAYFVPLAERLGLLREFDRWLLGEAWRVLKGDENGMALHVNLSAKRLRTGSITDDLAEAMGEFGVEPQRLVVEIPEAAWIHDSKAVVRQLEALKDLGVRVALDDFGSGYASFGYLQRLPIDMLKIDRVFVEGLGRDSGATALVEAVIRMGQSMSLEVVAEGVERAEHVASLVDLGCLLGQGSLLGRPVDAAQLAELLHHPIRN